MERSSLLKAQRRALRVLFRGKRLAGHLVPVPGAHA
jgi:hypothetical protein